MDFFTPSASKTNSTLVFSSLLWTIAMKKETHALNQHSNFTDIDSTCRMLFDLF